MQLRTISNDITESDFENPILSEPVKSEQKQTSANNTEKMFGILADILAGVLATSRKPNFALIFFLTFLDKMENDNNKTNIDDTEPETVTLLRPLPKMKIFGSVYPLSPLPIMEMYPSRIISEISQEQLLLKNGKNIKRGIYHCLIIKTLLFSIVKYI